MGTARVGAGAYEGEREELARLEARLRTLLPEQYHEHFHEVQPVSMGSAGLKFGPDGKVAWDAMWGSFCDLAMAGGPPHKGTLLEPASRNAIESDRGRYDEVVAEICRGIGLVTGLSARQAPELGWVRVECTAPGMAGWLTRAIVMENVSARYAGVAIELPAGPAFRLEKEIKNVITVVAKTCHYWGHLSAAQHREIARLFAAMELELPLMEPEGVAGWVGVECGDVAGAIWMMRMLMVSNVLARCEGTVMFVPEKDAVAEVVARLWSHAKRREPYEVPPVRR